MLGWADDCTGKFIFFERESYWRTVDRRKLVLVDNGQRYVLLSVVRIKSELQRKRFHSDRWNQGTIANSRGHETETHRRFPVTSQNRNIHIGEDCQTNEERTEATNLFVQRKITGASSIGDDNTRCHGHLIEIIFPGQAINRCRCLLCFRWNILSRICISVT